MLKPRKLKALPLPEFFGESTVKIIRMNDIGIPAKIIDGIIGYAKELSRSL
jgi:hypothetical protein